MGSDQPTRDSGGLTTAGKVVRLAALSVVRPVEFFDRARALVEIAASARRRAQETRTPHTPESWDTVAARAAALLDAQAAWSEADPGFAETRERVARRLRDAGSTRVPAAHDADPLLARLAYFLTLSLRPAVVLETGVALGVTSAYVLAALDRVGGAGRLVSIDRPPLGVPASDIGRAIPDELRTRWTLHVGTSTRVLPRILPQLPAIGLFIQDSLFTERNVRAEYAQVVPRLAERAVVIANAADRTSAFASIVQQANTALATTVRAEGKDELIGVALFRHDPAQNVQPPSLATSR